MLKHTIFLLFLFIQANASENDLTNIINNHSFDMVIESKGTKFNLKNVEQIDSLRSGLNNSSVPSGFISVTYEIDNKRLLNKYCKDRKGCTGPVKEALDAMTNKTKQICKNAGLHRHEFYEYMQRKHKINYGKDTFTDSFVEIVCAKPEELAEVYLSSHANTSEYLTLDIKINNLSIKQYGDTSNFGFGRLKDLVVKCDKNYYLSLKGPIDQDTTEVIERLVKKTPRCFYSHSKKQVPLLLYMESGGGYLKDGFAIGEILRENNILAIVPSDSNCSSSCATAFLGASKRKMGYKAELLFHAPYLTKQSTYGKRYIECQTDNDQLKTFYQKMLGAEDGKFLYDRTMYYCSSNSGWSINKDAAKLFGILKL